MVKSMFAAIAGLKTHQSKMDVISNNIANVNTWGYKTRSANFADAMYQNSIQGKGGNNAAGGSGGMNTSQVGFGVNMGSISTDFTTGSWSPTGNGLHCMINGPSFFIVGPMNTGGVNPTGLKASGLSLSRVGIFSVDNQGYLVDDQGNYVYGKRSNNPSADPQMFENDLKPIRVPTGNGDTKITDGATDPRVELQSYTIGQDGTIVGVDKAGKPYTLGKIAVASVENPNGLEQSQGYLYDIGANAGNVLAVDAGNDAVGKVLSGYLEMANVDLASEIASMITTQRGYQANSKIITVTDEMLEQLVNMKR